MDYNNKEHIFRCLHCGNNFIIRENEFNCRILRHAVYKDTLKEINPHTSKEECERLLNEGFVYGCAKPLRILQEKNSDGNYDLEICDYI
jgi:hypothetical protein